MSAPTPSDPAARRRLIESIFNAAADVPASDRPAILDERCAGDLALREEISKLLAQFDSGTLSLLRTANSPAYGMRGESPGDQIDRYRIVELLGEGGFGSVYIAEQTEPIRRNVALKILKAGMDTKSVLARFDAERQTLAMMDHPNIAKMFDAGLTPTARPYFVMELVQGVPLNQYCDRATRPIRQRIELFIDVCRAVQHAHQKGIIHRDLKPSNILVSEDEGRPLAKVIDFGIAKALHQPLLEQSLQTQQGQVIGTPEYMSPEQTSGGNDIDTRTDIYSLGVILYELVTGSLPFDSGSLRSRGLAAMQQIIREVDPPRPSTRLSSLAADAAEVAARNRQTDARNLVRQVRGDLEWIVIKCIEKDRARRYDSAAGLIADLERYLRDEPVTAGPPSRIYRTKKFVRRHKVGVAAGTAVAIAVILGAVGSSIGFIRASEQRDRAIDAERTAVQQSKEADLARERAETEAARAKAVTSFLTRMLASVKPSQARGREVTVKSVLDEASKQVESEFAADPEVQAELHMTIGSTYRVLERYNEAEPHLHSTLTTRESLLGKTHPSTLDARNEWIHWLTDMGRLDEAEEQILALESELRSANPPDDQRLSRALSTRGRVLVTRSKFKDAEPVLREALEIRRRAFATPSNEIADSLDALARSLDGMGRENEAIPLFEESLAMRAELHGEDSPGLGNTANNLASAFHDLGRYDDAERMYRKALGISEKMHGKESASYAQPLNNLAILYQDRGDYPKAEELFRESLAIRRKVYGDEHHAVANAINSLGVIAFFQKRYDEALAMYEEAYEMQCRLLGPHHHSTLITLGNIGTMMDRLKRHEDAYPVLRECSELGLSLFGPEHRFTLTNQQNLANNLIDLGRLLEAESYLRHVYDTRVRILGPDHLHTQITLRSLANVLAHQGRIAEAEALLHRSCDIAERREKPIESDLAGIRNTQESIRKAIERLEAAGQPSQSIAPPSLGSQ